MKQRIRLPKGAMLGLLFAAIMLLIGSTASAQLNWNPPCGVINIHNASGCGTRFTLVTNPGFLPAPLFIAPGVANFPGVPNPLQINGIVSFNGNFYPIIPGGPIMPPPAPPVAPCAWIPNVALGPPPGCCFDIFFDCRPGQCNVWLIPKPPPCQP